MHMIVRYHDRGLSYSRAQAESSIMDVVLECVDTMAPLIQN